MNAKATQRYSLRRFNVVPFHRVAQSQKHQRLFLQTTRFQTNKQA